MDIDYFNRFPNVLKKALISGKVSFPETLQKEYEDLNVYRGVKYNSDKTFIDKSDFLSYMELEKNPMIPIDENDISSYSCSVFLNIDELHMITKFPRKNKAVARGTVKPEYGPVDINELTSHVDLYLYDNADPSDQFEVIEVWEKNG